MWNNTTSAVPAAISSQKLHNTRLTHVSLPFVALRKGIKVVWGDLPSKTSWPDLYSALRLSQGTTEE